jgi:hypothetical protein
VEPIFLASLTSRNLRSAKWGLSCLVGGGCFSLVSETGGMANDTKILSMHKSTLVIDFDDAQKENEATYSLRPRMICA